MNENLLIAVHCKNENEISVKFGYTLRELNSAPPLINSLNKGAQALRESEAEYSAAVNERLLYNNQAFGL